jgi:Multiubiquitin
MNTETEEANAEHHRTIEIVVNGEPNVVSTRRLMFEDVVRLAFDDAVFNENVVYTVTYKRGPHQNREGTLVAGEAVFVTNGMIFNAKRTDKS